MSFRENENKQVSMNDSFNRLSVRAQKTVEKSWAKAFADYVFPAINERRFAVLYSSNPASRPNTPVNVIVGGLMLKEQCGLSDDELIESIICDVRFQYALHTTSMAEQPVSDRTFSRFREKLYHYEESTGIDLLGEELASLTEVYANYMNLTSNIKRMDSLMIASRCKRMTRLEILYTVVSNAVKLMKRLGLEERIPEETAHYLRENDHNDVIYHSKGEEVRTRQETVMREAVLVKEAMNDTSWHDFEEYTLLIRVLEEQTVIGEDGEIRLKENAEITSTSLQNPSDPDATFRKKAGKAYKGYTGNIIETVGEDGDSLITGIGFDVNVHSDSAFCREYLASRPDDAMPEVIITDGAYSGCENQALAAQRNVDLVTTALSGKEPNEIQAEFELSADGKTVVRCPAGKEPLRTSYHEKNETVRAVFDRACCEQCPFYEQCKPTKQKKSYVIHISKKTVARAKQIKKMSTEEYKKYARMRNAVEGVMSVLRRKFHVDTIPVFGKLRSKLFFVFKVAAYNFTKFLNFCRRTKGVVCPKPEISAVGTLFFALIQRLTAQKMVFYTCFLHCYI